MDREHESPAEALTELLKTLTTVALLRVVVLKELESFDNDDAIMKEHGFLVFVLRATSLVKKEGLRVFTLVNCKPFSMTLVQHSCAPRLPTPAAIQKRAVSAAIFMA
jgi:hypothetical protein